MAEVVWVLNIDHKYGANVTVHSDEAGARAELLAFVQAGWGDVVGLQDLDELPPADPEVAIEMYFDAMSGREAYSLNEAPVL